MGKVLLLSGGMDSAALAWWRKPDLAVFIDYGQRPAGAERAAAEMVAKAIGIPFEAVSVDCSPLGSGQLAGQSSLPEAPTPEWWPFRNQLLVTMAAAVALRHGGIRTVVIGSVAEDVVNADGTAAFRAALDQLMGLQEGGIGLEAPAAEMTGSELIRTSQIPPSVLGWTHSCFVGNVPCLRCRGCQKHLGVLEELNQRWPHPVCDEPA